MRLRGVLGGGLVCLGLGVGCGDRATPVGSLGDGGASASSSTGTPMGEPFVPTKVDVVLSIDNSGSMAPKQWILQQALAEFLQSLVDPPCVAGDAEVAASADGSCPPGYQRAHAPIDDLHVGVVSTSLGSRGSDSCLGTGSPSEDDRGRLLSRSAATLADPDQGAPIDTVGGLGFLAYGPHPAGGGMPVKTELDGLLAGVTSILEGVGTVGCGFEAQLESTYRFLVDPEPYDAIPIEQGVAVPKGVDQTVLAQRKAFLRPDSLVVVILLSDENDASVIAGGQNYLALQRYQPGTNKAFHLPKPRAACALDPNDACCRSCGQDPGPGCDTSKDACDANQDGLVDALAIEDDALNLRAFDTRRRFGVDFLEGVDRYVRGFSQPTVPDRSGTLVPNPLFSDLDPSDDAVARRDANHVVFAGIVGVPWQDLVRSSGDPLGRLKSASELEKPVVGPNSTWDVILGDPAKGIAPLDPHMRESIEPRTGKNPLNDVALAPPGSSPDANPINGAERAIAQRNDLQYACTFELPAPFECGAGKACDCQGEPGNPVCSPTEPTLQVREKAYPSLRELALLKALGDSAVVSSVCPIQLKDAALGSYGYRPAMRALRERVRTRL